jgi:hypothetical protein
MLPIILIVKFEINIIQLKKKDYNNTIQTISKILDG